MNPEPYGAGHCSIRESAVVSLGRWVEWWFSSRWRALVTWAAFAWISARLIDSGFRSWMDWVTRRLSIGMQSFVGHSPPAAVLEMSGVFGVMSWFQPLCLRLGVIRSTFWILIYVAIGVGIYTVYPSLNYRFSEAVFDSVLLAPMLGLPGLVAIGIRTRPWMSPCAAILSSVAVFVFWSAQGSLIGGALLANVPYATLMLYGTKPVCADRGRLS